MLRVFLFQVSQGDADFLTMKRSKALLFTILRFAKRRDVFEFRAMYSLYEEFVSNTMDTSYYTMYLSQSTMYPSSVRVYDVSLIGYEGYIGQYKSTKHSLYVQNEAMSIL